MSRKSLYSRLGLAKDAEAGKEGVVFNMLWSDTSFVQCSSSTLAKFFNHEIIRLADRSLMEIEENVDPGTEKRQF